MSPTGSTDRYAHLTAEALHSWKTAKWTSHAANVIPAWVAEMDFPTAAVLQRALIAAVEASETNYAPAGHGVEEACATWLAKHTGLEIEPGQVFIAADVLSGLAAALEVGTPAGCPIVVPTPSYPPFFHTIQETGRRVVEAPMQVSDGRWCYDLDAIDAAFASGARGIVVCHPHNPLGRVFDIDELRALADVVERHGARAIVDEVHGSLVYGGRTFRSYATVSEAATGHATTLTSASKGWNVAGLKCAQVIVTRKDDLPRWQESAFDLAHGASTLGLVANRVAFTEGDPWREETVAYLEGGRDLLGTLLREHVPGIHWIAPEATYLAWLDCRDLGVPNPATFFLEEARVAVNDGCAFGEVGPGHVRLNFGTSRSVLTEIVERMAEAVARL